MRRSALAPLLLRNWDRLLLVGLYGLWHQVGSSPSVKELAVENSCLKRAVTIAIIRLQYDQYGYRRIAALRRVKG